MDTQLHFNGFELQLLSEELRDKVLMGIVKAILHSGFNTPLTPKEITDAIMVNNYAHLGGNTPQATVSSRISTYFKKCNESNGTRVPILGRLLSQSNNRRIKYYIHQFPYIQTDSEYTVVITADHPVKPHPTITTSASAAAISTAKRLISNTPIAKKKRKLSASAMDASKAPSSKKPRPRSRIKGSSQQPPEPFPSIADISKSNETAKSLQNMSQDSDLEIDLEGGLSDMDAEPTPMDLHWTKQSDQSAPASASFTERVKLKRELQKNASLSDSSLSSLSSISRISNSPPIDIDGSSESGGESLSNARNNRKIHDREENNYDEGESSEDETSSENGSESAGETYVPSFSSYHHDPTLPPQNPEQTYAFSPVFQPRIFIRPNTTSLPPLSTLQNQSAISHSSPPLISASPAVNPYQNSQHSSLTFPSRLSIPSPILLPSPRGPSIFSPHLNSGGMLSNLHPLDLGPGLYPTHQQQHQQQHQPQQQHSSYGLYRSQNELASAHPIQHPESVSVQELDQLFSDYDACLEKNAGSPPATFARKSDLRRRRTSILKTGGSQRLQQSSNLKEEAAPNRPILKSTSVSTRSVQRDVNVQSKSTEAALMHSKQPILRRANRSSPIPIFNAKIPCELSDVHINLPNQPHDAYYHQSNGSNSITSGQIITISRFKSGPSVHMALHTILVRGETASYPPPTRVNQPLTDFIRVGDLMQHYRDPRLYERSVVGMDTRFVALWAQFLKELLELSLSRGVRSTNANAADGKKNGHKEEGGEQAEDEEMEAAAAMSLIGLASPVLEAEVADSGDVVHGGESFAVKVCTATAGGELPESIFTSDLVVVVLKAGSGSSGISHECNGIWIPMEICKYFTDILNVPARINDLYQPAPEQSPILLSTFSNLQGVRVRSYSTSSYSSASSSIRKPARSTLGLEENGAMFLQFDSDNNGSPDIGSELLEPAALPLEEDTQGDNIEDGSRMSKGDELMDVAHGPAVAIDPSSLTLIPASNISEALMWMTTIDGVFVYITWIAVQGGPSSTVGTPILRRVDNGMVNASQLLHAGGMHSNQEKSVVLSLERVKKRFRRAESSLRGTWIPLNRARELARTVGLEQRLNVFLSDEAGSTYFGVVAPSRSAAASVSESGRFGTASPMRRKKVAAASLSIGPDGIMRVAKVKGLNGDTVSRKLSGLLAGALGSRARGSPMFSSSTSMSSFDGAGSLLPRRPMYPPGSLAELEHQRALEALSDGSPGVAPTDVAFVDSPAGGRSMFGSVEHIQPESAISTSERSDSKSSTEIQSKSEASTRSAIAALANSLAQTTRTNRQLSPPIIAATLAAFATGLKKVNEALRKGTLTTVPTSAELLTTFAASVKKIDDSNGASQGLEAMFPAVSLSALMNSGKSGDGQAMDILAQLGASIESSARKTAQNLNQPNAAEGSSSESPHKDDNEAVVIDPENATPEPEAAPQDLPMKETSTEIPSNVDKSDDEFDTWSNYDGEAGVMRPRQSTSGKNLPNPDGHVLKDKGIPDQKLHSGGKRRPGAGPDVAPEDDEFDEELEALFDSSTDSLTSAASAVKSDPYAAGTWPAHNFNQGETSRANVPQPQSGGKGKLGGKASLMFKEMLERERLNMSADMGSSSSSNSSSDDEDEGIFHKPEAPGAHSSGLGGKGRLLPPAVPLPLPTKRSAPTPKRKASSPVIPKQTKRSQNTPSGSTKKPNVNIIPPKKAPPPKTTGRLAPPPVLPPPTFVEATDEDEDVDILN
ncbi:hypothetical protein HDU81_003616 [Chytriomyces hyalinus]|nr:hypothetical protein HDU81_003616 [Chytriomyces hyalinus]